MAWEVHCPRNKRGHAKNSFARMVIRARTSQDTAILLSPGSEIVARPTGATRAFCQIE